MSEREPIRSRVPASDTDRQDRLDDLNPPPRHPEPQSLTELLETRRHPVVREPHEEVDACYDYCAACDEEDPCVHNLLIDLALAAERRRQASDEYDNSTGLYSVIQEAERAEDAALDRLADHLRGGAA